MAIGYLEICKLIHDESIKFLENSVVTYYAGLDYKSLPFNKSPQKIYNRPDIHIAYLTALSLVVDHIILPPSFNISWFSTNISKFARKKLIDLYQSNILISPIYKGMNVGINFLSYKLSKASKVEYRKILEAYPVLYELFSEIPVFNRDIRHQSHGFRAKALEEFNDYAEKPVMYQHIIKPFLIPESDEVEISRDKLFIYLKDLLKTNRITRKEYIKLYLKVNKAYYTQGAQTHDSYISLLNTKLFSTYEKNLYLRRSNILIGYDPIILLSILKSLGIPVSVLFKMDISDILKLREPYPFLHFKKLYNNLSVQMQRFAFLTNSSQIDLRQLSIDLIKQINNQYKKENSYVIKFKYNYKLIEAMIYLMASTGIGILVSDILSYLIGAASVLMLIRDTSEKVSDFILRRISCESSSLYSTIHILETISDKYYGTIENKYPPDTIL